MSPHEQVVHLHNHSEHSCLDGLSRLKGMCQIAAEQGQDAIALTDHGTLGGAWKFAKAAKEVGIKPIQGCELYLSLGAREERNEEIEPRDDEGDTDADDDSHGKTTGGGDTKTRRYQHLTVLAGSTQGWDSLVRIQSAAHSSFWYKPRADFDLLARHSEGLIVLTGCLGGPVASKLKRGDYEGARANLGRLIEAVGKDNVYVEVMDHGIAAERKVTGGLVDLAREFWGPADYEKRVVATNDAHYPRDTDAAAHDAWLAVGVGRKLDDTNRFAFKGTGYFIRSAEQMRGIFDDGNGTGKAVDTTLDIAERCSGDVLPASELRLPQFPTPQGFTGDAAAYLKHQVRAGAQRRYGAPLPQPVRDRLNFEFTIISDMGLADYFLIVADIIDASRKHGVRVGPGRGCLHGDSLVWTEAGYKTIRDVAVGDRVRTHTGAVRPVANTFRYDVDEKLVTLRAFSDGNGVTMTGDHKVLIRRGEYEARPERTKGGAVYSEAITSPLEWVRSDQVSVGDLLCVPRPQATVVSPGVIDVAPLLPPAPAGTTFTVTSTEIIESYTTNKPYPHSVREVAAALSMSRQVMQGMLARRVPDSGDIIESCANRWGGLLRRRSVRQMRARDRLVAELRSRGFATLADWDRYVGITSTVVVRTPRFIPVNEDLCFLMGAWASNGWLTTDSGRSVGFAERRSTADDTIALMVKRVWGLGIQVASSTHSDLLQYDVRCAAVRALFRSFAPDYVMTAQTKHLPDWVLGLSAEHRRSLLDGLWWGDGTISGGRWQYATSSPALMHQVRDLIWSLGAPAGVDVDVDERTDARPGYANRSIGWRIRTTPKFVAPKAQFGGADEDYIYLRVRAVQASDRATEVFDLEVPVEHSFMTDSYVVHNSSAGSVTSYCLEIVNVDPLAHGLLFERFLDPARVGMPDVDIDFDTVGRDWAINYAVTKYGADRVARIGTFGMARSRQAIKNAARVLDHVPIGNELSKLVPIVGDGKPMDFDQLDDEDNGSSTAFRAKVAASEEAKAVIELARSFEGVVAQEGIHACGVVIADATFDGLVPLRWDHRKGAEADTAVTVWDGKDMDDAQFLKLDFLGLRNLDVISEAVRLIEATTGEVIDADNPPTDPTDERVRTTWAGIRAGRTAGLFQLDGSGMTKLCEQIAPESVADLSAIIALYRPGPLGAKMDVHYVARKRGEEDVDYAIYTADPAEQAVIASVLNDTYGVPIYQESLMILGELVAGFGPAEKNRLRRAFSKKKRPEIEAMKVVFIDGAQAEVIDERGVVTKMAFAVSTAEKLWETFDASAEYIFNKCLTGDTVLPTGVGEESWELGELYRKLSTIDTPGPVCGWCATVPSVVRGLCLGCYSWHQDFHSADKGFTLLSYDAADGRIRPKRVRDVHHNGVRDVWRIETGEGHVVRATAQHRFLVPLGWVRVSELAVGAHIAVDAGHERAGACHIVAFDEIVSITADGCADTYDVEMDDVGHNFVANGIVSHNSHSVAYGQTAYITAYLKANWPSQYGAALLAVTSQDDKRQGTLNALREEGVAVAPPSLRLGGISTLSTEDGTVRLGMREIKGVGDAARWIVAERDTGGPFESVRDLLRRVKVPATPGGPLVNNLGIGAVDGLIEAGALDEYGPRLGMKMALRAERDSDNVEVPDMEWGSLERAARERDRLGLVLSAHPLVTLKDQVKIWRPPGMEGKTRPMSNVPVPVQKIGAVDGAEILTLGVLASWAERSYSRGRMANIVLEGSTSAVECVLWDEQLLELKADGDLPVVGSILALRGKVTVTTVDTGDEDGGNEERRQVTARRVWKVTLDDDARLAMPAASAHVPLRRITAIGVTPAAPATFPTTATSPPSEVPTEPTDTHRSSPAAAENPEPEDTGREVVRLTLLLDKTDDAATQLSTADWEHVREQLFPTYPWRLLESRIAETPGGTDLEVFATPDGRLELLITVCDEPVSGDNLVITSQSVSG